MSTFHMSFVQMVAAAGLVAGAGSASAGDLVVRSRETKSYDCRGGSVTIEGGGNVLTLRNCSRLVVEGGDNTIDAGFVDSIEVSGAGNKITWWESADGRRPALTNEGERNVIASKRAPASAAASAAPAPTAAAPASSGATDQVTISGGKVKIQDADGSVSVGADGSVTLKDGASRSGGTNGQVVVTEGRFRIDKDGLKEAYDCKGGAAIVNGSRNDLTLTNCSQISVNGSANVIAVRASPQVSINGNDNKLTWEAAADGSRPRITDNGKGNTVGAKR